MWGGGEKVRGMKRGGGGRSREERGGGHCQLVRERSRQAMSSCCLPV